MIGRETKSAWPTAVPQSDRWVRSGEIHSLAEQLTGMQKNLHDEFLQKIAGMIQVLGE